MKGTVRYFDARGFGFIQPLGAGPDDDDIFVHASACPGKLGRRNLQRGQVVEFELAKDLKGRRVAINVRIIPAPEVGVNVK